MFQRISNQMFSYVRKFTIISFIFTCLLQCSMQNIQHLVGFSCSSWVFNFVLHLWILNQCHQNKILFIFSISYTISESNFPADINKALSMDTYFKNSQLVHLPQMKFLSLCYSFPSALNYIDCIQETYWHWNNLIYRVGTRRTARINFYDNSINKSLSLMKFKW